MVFLKNKTLKAEKAVRSGGNQVGAWNAYIGVNPNVGQMWTVLSKLWFELKEVKREVGKQWEAQLGDGCHFLVLCMGWSFNEAD